MAGAGESQETHSHILLSTTYDVFLSFRGEDTRKTFTNNLYTRLCKFGVNTFRDDDELRRGREIASELLKAIEESRISIVIFSENYACVLTSWEHTGSFGEALKRHEERFGSQKVESWRSALTAAANISGWHLENIDQG
ncbi:hypothetical protein T459_12378 [Capsicum annuum]|uniref:TIR domain-containing protein n=1 Tax=Capsicum annuum TaxID=4072 RepID=A0A2G2ZPQ3_CAPAN|nr:hypothetical protein T459_12378 [Capsicum annuum]